MSPFWFMYVGCMIKVVLFILFLDVFLFIVIVFRFVTYVSLLVAVLVGKGYIVCVR